MNEDVKKTYETKGASPDLSQQQRRLSAATASIQRLQNGQSLASSDSGELVPPVVGEQYLVFSLHEQEFAVKAELVQGVERPMYITPVPNVVSWVRGVVNLRGAIASVVDLRAFLGLEEVPASPRTRLLSLQTNEMVICVTVDSVSEMLPISPEHIVSDNSHMIIPQWIAPFATNYALFGNRVVVLLDVAHLLFSDKMQRY